MEHPVFRHKLDLEGRSSWVDTKGRSGHTLSLSKPTTMSLSLSLSLSKQCRIQFLHCPRMSFLTYCRNCQWSPLPSSNASPSYGAHLGNSIHKIPPEVCRSQEEYLCLLRFFSLPERRRKSFRFQKQVIDGRPRMFHSQANPYPKP